MKPSQSREDRDLSQADRGYAAAQLLESDLVVAWFEAHRSDLVKKMLSAPISDDQTRRDAAIEINAVDTLKRHLEHEASKGRQAVADIEKRKKL